MISNKYIIKIFFTTTEYSMIKINFLINLVKLGIFEHRYYSKITFFWDVGSSFMDPNMSLPSSPYANLQKITEFLNSRLTKRCLIILDLFGSWMFFFIYSWSKSRYMCIMSINISQNLAKRTGMYRTSTT